MRLRFLLLLVAACATTAFAAAAPAPRLLVLGDSLSSGYGIDPSRGWVALLERRLAAESFRYRVINASISGDTAAGGLRRLPALLEAHRPELLIVELGANDGLRGVPLDVLRRNLVALVEQARSVARAVLLLGVRLPPNYGPRYADAFHRQYAEVARETGVALVPALLAGIGERRNLLQEDGLHPRAAAQPLILDNVWPALVPLLEP